MKWIEIKMRELGVSTHSGYKLAAFMDNTAMVTVHTAQRGECMFLVPSVLLQPHCICCVSIGYRRSALSLCTPSDTYLHAHVGQERWKLYLAFHSST